MAVVYVCEKVVLSLIQIAVTSIGECYLLEHGELNNEYTIKEKNFPPSCSYQYLLMERWKFMIPSPVHDEMSQAPLP